MNIFTWLQNFTGLPNVNVYIFFGLVLLTVPFFLLFNEAWFFLGIGWAFRATLNLVKRKQTVLKIILLTFLNFLFSLVFIYLGILKTKTVPVAKQEVP